MTYPTISIDEGSVAVIMKKRLHTSRLLIIFICIALIIGGAGIFFWRTGRSSQVPSSDAYPVDPQTANLHKLAKVWGFAKYTHLAFLTGERCWDEELLSLIPIIKFADPEDVNEILYDWFLSLGDDGYDLDYVAFRTILLIDFPDHEYIINDFFEDTNNHNWSRIDELHEELWLLNTGYEMNLRPMADLSWINEDYLGVSLATNLSRFHKIQVVDWDVAPVYFDEIGRTVFINKERFVEIDYADNNFRLLGLFRLWNTIKYFFPYLDIIDYDWGKLLLECIPKMLTGTDRLSYEATLVTLASKLRDAHISFIRGSIMMGEPLSSQHPIDEIFDLLFGSFFVPITLREAEGHLVVSNVRNVGRGLMPGDVILQVNGINIDEITEAMLQYLPYPNTDKSLAYLVFGHTVLRQHSNATPMAIDVYRFGEELRVYVSATARNPFNYIWYYVNSVSTTHTILDNNIGLINPSMIMFEEIHRNTVLHNIMKEFEDININGLIIDLRQRPQYINYLLAEYILEGKGHFVTMSRPWGFVPGLFADNFRGYSGYGTFADWSFVIGELGSPLEREESFNPFFHNQNIVLLMNEHTGSHGEFTVMSLRGGTNVTVMGTNSIGANGDVIFLPLPGGITMMYTGLGVYLPDGGQTQRIGLSPDIYIHRTVEGIRDGRDELMEAAIQFLLEQVL